MVDIKATAWSWKKLINPKTPNAIPGGKWTVRTRAHQFNCSSQQLQSAAFTVFPHKSQQNRETTASILTVQEQKMWEQRKRGNSRLGKLQIQFLPFF